MFDFDNIRHEDLTNEEYHGRDMLSISNSRGVAFDNDPQFFLRKFGEKSIDDERTADLEYGTLFHELVLENPSVVDATNYDEGTLALFRPVESVPDGLECVKGSREESIFLNDRGVYRASRFWGEIGDFVSDCRVWYRRERSNTGDSDFRVGFCPFDEMQIDGDLLRHVPSFMLTKDGKKSGKKYDEWEKDFSGLSLLTPGGNYGWLKLFNMRSEIMRHDRAKQLLYCPDGQNEFSLIGTDRETGLEVRCRYDRVVVIDGVRYIIDLKTTRDVNPKKWRRQAHEDYLDVQCALGMLLGNHFFDSAIEYRYVAVDKGGRNRVVVYKLQREFIEIGLTRLRAILDNIAKCRDSGRWECPDHDGEVTLTVPSHLQFDSQLAFKKINEIDLDDIVDSAFPDIIE